MAESKGVTVPVRAELTGLGAAVAHTPNDAQIVDGGVTNVRYAVSVTEQHGLQLVTIDERDHQGYPHRATGTRTVSELDSFLAELERRPLYEDGTLWGSAHRGRLTAVYNDHTIDDAGWRDDRLELALATDPDWHAWHELSGKFFRQEEFGDRIEELLHTVTKPDQAELLEIIDSVRASTRGEFESGIERADGSQRLTYKVEHTVKAGRSGQLEVPQVIVLELRPWDGHPQTYGVAGYFRVRVNEGVLTLAIKLKPTRQIVRQAWADLTEQVTEDTGKPVYAIS
ncbi:DUF2303 family protein [Mycobacterium eburneum]|nr:DUF2303 family protein [Mycobacterium eburneum]TDH57528.1 DUF2303 family protein [Mycobacterium eburneum]